MAILRCMGATDALIVRLFTLELLLLAEKVGWRLRQAGCRARTIQLKLRLADFTTYTRSRTLPEGTCYDEVLYQTARELYGELKVAGPVRLAVTARYRLGAYDEDDSRDLEGMGDRKDSLFAGLALQASLLIANISCLGVQ